jgi:ubiquitin C-terminal hydrolase
MTFILRGLPNTGYTCYLNSILQILANTKEMRMHDSKSKRTTSSNTDVQANVICDAYENWLSVHISHSSDRENAAALRKFIVSFKDYYQNFGSGMQDQYEYLLLLLKLFHDSRSVRCDDFEFDFEAPVSAGGLQAKALENLRKDGMWVSFDNNRMANSKHKYGWDSVVFRTFTGQFHTETICNTSSCGHVSHRFETFRILDVDIPDHKAHLNLQDCLAWTLRETQLDKDNSYECDKCHKKSRCVRKTSVWLYPNVLILCLKRFIARYSSDGRIMLDKNQADVSIPLNMDLSNSKYELYAIAHHTGGQRGGHCFSSLKKPGGKWVTVDDTAVSMATDGTFCGSTPYLLFYRTVT